MHLKCKRDLNILSQTVYYKTTDRKNYTNKYSTSFFFRFYFILKKLEDIIDRSYLRCKQLECFITRINFFFFFDFIKMKTIGNLKKEKIEKRKRK